MELFWEHPWAFDGQRQVLAFRQRDGRDTELMETFDHLSVISGPQCSVAINHNSGRKTGADGHQYAQGCTRISSVNNLFWGLEAVLSYTAHQPF